MAENLTDAEKVRQMLGDFKYTESDAWNLINTKLGRTLNHTELTKLSELFCQHFHLKTNRYEKRNKELIVKFFQTHYNDFQVFLEGIAFEDKNHQFGGPKAQQLMALSTPQ